MATTSTRSTESSVLQGRGRDRETTWLSGSIRKTAQTRHTGRLLVASFTRTAAQEIAGRGLPLESSQVGTLHSLAWRAVGHPDVAQEQLPEWNRLHPELAQTVQKVPGQLEDSASLDFVGSTDGDAMMAKLDEVRARRIPVAAWPVPVQSFSRKWEAWKADAEVVDFTDMIEMAMETTDAAPNDPVVGFFDETQDLTPLELGLVRHWGRRMDRVVMAGDDDQAIYGFRGADPTAFITPDIPDERKWVLGQSYRVPSRVQEVAERWVKRLRQREPKEYRPRDAEGGVRFGSDFTYQNPDPVIRDVVRQIDAGQRVMVQATCAYMLDPIKHALKAQGVPFHNPYRPRTDWNPLRASRGTSGADKVLAYLILDERIFGDHARAWTGKDVKRWSMLVKKQGVFRRGVGGMIGGLPDRTLTFEEVASLFDSDDQLEEAVEPSLDWLQRNLLASQRQTAEYPIRVVRRRGAQALLDVPPVAIGTVHCSPPDELVRTTNRGWVPIGELDQETDRLASWVGATNTVSGLGGHFNSRGSKFVAGSNPYDGRLVVVESPEGRTRVTPDHRLPVRLGDRFLNRWCVYLMRRGGWWRVGTSTTGYRPYRSGGVRGRLASEQADAGWVLGVYDSKEEALAAEFLMQSKYGVPSLTFERTQSGRTVLSKRLHELHEEASAYVQPRVKVMMDELGLREDQPLYRRGTHRVRQNDATFTTWASNLPLLSGRFEVLYPSTRPDGKPCGRAVLATATTEHYEGLVLSLEVLPHHHYLSGGHVVHNSFKGAEADVVYVFPDVSTAGMREWSDVRTRDSVIRQFYVAMTRAKEELVICNQASHWAVDPTMMYRGGARRSGSSAPAPTGRPSAEAAVRARMEGRRG